VAVAPQWVYVRPVRLQIRQMGDEDAHRVAAWRYEAQYAFYDADSDADDLTLLLAAESREGRYFAAFAEDELVGFFEFQLERDDIVIGLGLRPDLTGRGLGLSFMQEGMAFARDRFRRDRFRLSVAAFNERSIGSTSERVFVRCERTITRRPVRFTHSSKWRRTNDVFAADAQSVRASIERPTRLRDALHQRRQRAGRRDGMARRHALRRRPRASKATR
jgi:[ribosomal protein S18]-alanine N-acetyltransferase